MNKQLEQLIKVSDFDKAIDAFEPEIENKRSDIYKINHLKERKQTDLLRAQEDKRSILLQISTNNQSLQNINTKLEDIARKKSMIKSERELRALSIEEDIAKEQATHANQEIQRLELEGEHKDKQQQALQEEIQKYQEQVDELEDKISVDIEKIRQKQQEILAQKEILVATMDKHIIQFYEKIRKWAKNTAVVPIKRQACGGCFMYINDRTSSAIARDDEIITCPHCGRILYIEPSVIAS